MDNGSPMSLGTRAHAKLNRICMIIMYVLASLLMYIAMIMINNYFDISTLCTTFFVIDHNYAKIVMFN